MTLAQFNAAAALIAEERIFAPAHQALAEAGAEEDAQAAASMAAVRRQPKEG